MNRGARLIEVNEKWYYSRGKHEPITGPFDTLQEASEALTYELERQHGPTDQSYLTETATKEKS